MESDRSTKCEDPVTTLLIDLHHKFSNRNKFRFRWMKIHNLFFVASQKSIKNRGSRFRQTSVLFVLINYKKSQLWPTLDV